MSQYREVVELLPCYLGLVAQRGRGDGPLQIQFQLKGTATLARGTGPYPFLLVLICRPFVMTSTVRVDARGAQGAWNGGGGGRGGYTMRRRPFVPALSVTRTTLVARQLARIRSVATRSFVLSSTCSTFCRYFFRVDRRVIRDRESMLLGSRHESKRDEQIVRNIE